MTRELSCAFVMLIASSLAAQEEPVLIGGDISPEAVRLVRERQAAGLYSVPEDRRQMRTVPIVFHIVRDRLGRVNDPSGRNLDERIPEAMKDLNEHYATSSLRFCQAGPPLFIDSDFWAEWEPGATFDELLQIGRVEGAVNVYLYPKPTIIGGIICFTWTPIQSIGINFNAFNDKDLLNTVQLTEMISYYFDVLQTQEDNFGIECASGANCATAGDLVCDTPADEGQNILFTTCDWVFPPPYQGQCPGDPTYTPDKTNIMAQRSRICLDHLTQGQQDRAYATLVNIRHELSRTMCACPADCDLSGELDIFDFLCFQDAFAEGEPYACDRDTSTGPLTCDVFDFLAFQDEFVGGCP